MAARVHPGNLRDAEIVASLTAVVLDDRHAGNHLGPANTPQVHSKYTVPGIRFDPCPSDRPLRRLRPNDEVLARHPGKPSHHRSGHDHGAPSARPVHVVDRHREWRLHLRHALILNRRAPCGPPSSGQPACYDDATRRRQAPTNGDRRRHQSILVTAPSRTFVSLLGRHHLFETMYQTVCPPYAARSLPPLLPAAVAARADPESHHLDNGRACVLADGPMVTELCSRTRATDRWEGRPSIQLAGWS
jgi:hypothetical protein